MREPKPRTGDAVKSLRRCRQMPGAARAVERSDQGRAVLHANRNSPVACPECGRTVPRRARQQRFCSTRCRNRAKNRNRSRKAFLGPARHPTLGGEPNLPKKPSKIKALQGVKSAQSTLLKRDFRRPVDLPAGIVPDERWPGMYRVQLADGSLSDMFNLARAKDLAATFKSVKRRRAG